LGGDSVQDAGVQGEKWGREGEIHAGWGGL
jgi:hypothetical protein